MQPGDIVEINQDCEYYQISWEIAVPGRSNKKMVRLVCDMYCSVPSHPTPCHHISARQPTKYGKYFSKEILTRSHPPLSTWPLKCLSTAFPLQTCADNMMTTLDQHFDYRPGKKFAQYFLKFTIKAIFLFLADGWYHLKWSKQWIAIL